MKHYLPILFLFFAGVAQAADINPAVRTPDNSQQININYRDRSTNPTTYAPTYNMESIYSFSQFNSTRTVSTNPGLLHSVVISSGVIHTGFIIYDSTTVTDTTRPIAKFTGKADIERTYLFNVQVTSGIQVNGFASGSEATITYR